MPESLVGSRLSNRGELVERDCRGDTLHICIDDFQFKLLACLHLTDERRIGAIDGNTGVAEAPDASLKGVAMVDP